MCCDSIYQNTCEIISKSSCQTSDKKALLGLYNLENSHLTEDKSLIDQLDYVLCCDAGCHLSDNCNLRESCLGSIIPNLKGGSHMGFCNQYDLNICCPN